MKHPLLFTAVFCATAVLAPVGAQTPSPAEAPPSHRSRCRPSSTGCCATYERAWRSGDATAVAALFAEDGYVLQSGRNPIRGVPRSRTHTRARPADRCGCALRVRDE
jgi:hypothetical protein